MAATGSDSQQLLAAADVDAEALSDRVSRFFDDIASLVLPLLQLDERALAACTRKAWRAAAAEPMLWAELEFELCAVRVTDATLAALCARAGPALRSLCLNLLPLDHVTVIGLVAALRDGGCVNVRRISVCTELVPQLSFSLTPLLAVKLFAACKKLEHTAFLVSSYNLKAAAHVAAALPGPLSLQCFLANRTIQRPLGFPCNLLLSSVTSLELNDCELSPKEFAALSGELYKKNSTLKELKLPRNHLGAWGAVVLREVLFVNTTLTTLDLFQTGICSAGAVALAEALLVNSTLTALNLGDNRIDGGGAAALLEMLRFNKTVRTLHLHKNHHYLSAASLAALRQAGAVHERRIVV